MLVGYAYVHDSLKLAALPPRRPARVQPVTRIERMADHIAVPAHVAPGTADPLQHLGPAGAIRTGG
ncbi:MAG TPA: hypothetical protein VF161_00620 [Steroidobacteraceae bacterium]|jgi:hypothetical protein